MSWACMYAGERGVFSKSAFQNPYEGEMKTLGAVNFDSILFT